jgi:hypothetical protein
MIFYSEADEQTADNISCILQDTGVHRHNAMFLIFYQ